MNISKEDEELLANYAGTLINLWMTKEDKEFPLNMEENSDWIGVLGLPKVSYQFKWNSREELWGHIHCLSHFLGAETLKAVYPDGTVGEVKL